MYVCMYVYACMFMCVYILLCIHTYIINIEQQMLGDVLRKLRLFEMMLCSTCSSMDADTTC